MTFKYFGELSSPKEAQRATKGTEHPGPAEKSPAAPAWVQTQGRQRAIPCPPPPPLPSPHSLLPGVYMHVCVSVKCCCECRRACLKCIKTRGAVRVLEVLVDCSRSVIPHPEKCCTVLHVSGRRGWAPALPTPSS